MQVSSLISPTLPNVPPPTTGVTRTSLYTPTAACPVCFRLRISPASSPSLPAESSSSPADRQFASGCSPPRLAATQLPSATGTWLTPTRTLTVLCVRLHERTGGDFSRPRTLINGLPVIQCAAGEFIGYVRVKSLSVNSPASAWGRITATALLRFLAWAPPRLKKRA